VRFLFFIAHCSHLTRSLPMAPFPRFPFHPLPSSPIFPIAHCIHTMPPLRGQMPFWGMLCPQKAPSAWTNAILGYVVSTKYPLCVDKCYSGEGCVHKIPSLRGQMPFWGRLCPQNTLSAWTARAFCVFGGL